MERLKTGVGIVDFFIVPVSLLRRSHHTFTEVRRCLNFLQIAEIPKLTSGCTEFVDSAENILEKRKMNQTLLANQSTLLDLLEIPQLMDTYAPVLICQHFKLSNTLCCLLDMS